MLLSKQLLLSQLINVTRISVSEFTNSLGISAADGAREAYFKTSIVFDSDTGVDLFLAGFMYPDALHMFS